MKLKIFSLLVVLVVMSVTPMIYTGKFDPESWIKTVISGDFFNFNKLQVKLPSKLKKAVIDEKVQVYKWRDEHGIMQFSSTAPVGSNNAERIEINTGSNVVDAVNVPVKQEKKEAPAAAVESASPYSVKAMKKVIDDAKDVEETLQQRTKQQQKMIENL